MSPDASGVDGGTASDLARRAGPARDRRVYLLSHPVLFALLAALRRDARC